MAGIEKVCEFSGEYGSGSMYVHKRDHIQILPKWRKYFQGAKHEFYVTGKELRYRERGTGFTIMAESINDEYRYFYSDVYSSFQEFLKGRGYTPYFEYEYVLHIFDEHLQGEVKGKYLNYSSNLGSVKRRLKRMLRCKKLNVVKKN